MCYTQVALDGLTYFHCHWLGHGHEVAARKFLEFVEHHLKIVLLNPGLFELLHCYEQAYIQRRST